MGFEYKISFARTGSDSDADSISTLPGAKNFAAPEARIEFRRDQSEAGMPDATASLENYGLYFCVHGGVGWEYLGQVVVNLVRAFGAVTVEDLE